MLVRLQNEPIEGRRSGFAGFSRWRGVAVIQANFGGRDNPKKGSDADVPRGLVPALNIFRTRVASAGILEDARGGVLRGEYGVGPQPNFFVGEDFFSFAEAASSAATKPGADLPEDVK